jgi:hypothetical protein
MASSDNIPAPPEPAIIHPIANPPGPLPPTGAAHPDATNVAPADQNLAPSSEQAPPPETVRPTDAHQFVGSSSGPNPMYKATSSQPFASVFQPGTSTFIPSSNVLFYMIYIMDPVMAQTHRWTQSAVSWHPVISRIYFTVLFYVQILRCMEAADVLHRNGIAFLHGFMDAYPLHTLAIPGPLVPIFEALSASIPSPNFFGTVTPIIPDAPTEDQAHSYVMSENVRNILPDLPHLIEQANLLIGNTTYQFRRTLGGQTLRTTAAEGNAPADSIRTWNAIAINPALRYPAMTTATTRNNFAENGPFLRLPRSPPIGTETTPLDWYQFLFFDADADVKWFGRIAGLMGNYCRFFTQARSLNDCSPTARPTSQIRSYMSLPVPRATATVTGHYPNAADIDALIPAFPFSVRNTHANLSITTTDEQIALLAQLNLVDGSEPSLFGRVTTTLTGPFWTVAPEMRTSPTVDPTPSIENIVPSRMHNSAAEPV